MSNNKQIPVSIVLNGKLYMFAGFDTYPPGYEGLVESQPKTAVYKCEDGVGWTHQKAKDFIARDHTQDTYATIPAYSPFVSSKEHSYRINVDAKGDVSVVEYLNGGPNRIICDIKVEGEEGVAIAKTICGLLNNN